MMSKTAKKALIAGAICAVLAVVVVILLLTSPKKTLENASDSSLLQAQSVVITEKAADSVLAISVKNERGNFTFSRKTRVYTDKDGKTANSYYWTSEELLGVGQNDNSVRSFVSGFSSLTAKDVVEESAVELEKYGLKEPRATVTVKFDDGTEKTLRFGITNPANLSTVYFTDGEKIMLASESGISGAFGEVKDYANLLITKALGSSEHVDYLTITRKDMSEPIEIRYMSELEAARDSEKYVVTTLNTHRFTSPYTAEINVQKGGKLCGGVCGLTMKECAYLEANEENLAKCGLLDPFCTVKFSYGGEERTLLLGDKAKQIVSQSSSDTPELYEVTGYYAVLVGVPGIFIAATEAAPWYSANPADYVSARPISPYIFGCESVSVSVSGKTYNFSINGTEKTVSIDGKTVDIERFKKLFEQLVGSVGEEVYTGESTFEPELTVKFTYTDDYARLYGVRENVLDYASAGERKDIVLLDGKPIFKVRAVYAKRLAENIEKLLCGEDFNIVW